MADGEYSSGSLEDAHAPCSARSEETRPAAHRTASRVKHEDYSIPTRMALLTLIPFELADPGSTTNTWNVRVVPAGICGG